MDDLLRDFLTETGEHLDIVDAELVRLERDPDNVAVLRNVFRLVHTIKGTCGFLGLPRLEALAHAAESLMGPLRDGAPVTTDAVGLIFATVDRLKFIVSELDRMAVEPPGSDADLIASLESLAAEPAAVPPRRLGPAVAAEPARPAGEPARPVAEPSVARSAGPASPGTIRVAVDTLEHLITTVSELVLTRNQLLDVSRRSGQDGAYTAPLQRLSQVTAELQDGIMKARLQPVGSVWAKLPRLVRDLGPELGKQLTLRMTGSETELDRQVLELIRDPLTHLVRNAADHGIEPPAERARHGKPATGTIRLHAFQEGGAVTIEVGDDGRGLDGEAIRRRAAALGIANEADLANLVFHPGFSTAARVSTVSGRGIGLDVVRANIEGIGGTVAIRSEPGKGATFTVKIPLTLAIMGSLVVVVGGHRFAIPQVAVVELVAVRGGGEHALERVGATAMLRLRRELLPVVDLAELFRLERVVNAPDEGFVAVVTVGRQRFGFLVDRVLDTQEIVVKPLATRLKPLGLFSGTTILGDGTVVLIVDPTGVARASGAVASGEAAPAATPDGVEPDGPDRTALLVFRGSDGVLKALPLSLVTRLEELDGAAIDTVGGRPWIPYRGRLMPLVELGGELRRSGRQPVVVVTQGERHLGLAVQEILDVADEAVAIEPVPNRPDLVGTAIVRGRPTEIVDLAAHLPAGAPARPPSSSGAVLLVDDNGFFRDLLAPVIRAAGYRVRTAASAGEALALLAARPVGTVVVDHDLPDGSGLDLVAALRRDVRGGSDVTAILLAAASTPALLERARALDVFDVVSKFDRSGLLDALAEAGGGEILAEAA